MSLFPFLETTCTMVAPQTKTENEKYNYPDGVPWTSVKTPDLIEQDEDDPFKASNEQGRRDRLQDAKDIGNPGGSPLKGDVDDPHYLDDTGPVSGWEGGSDDSDTGHYWDPPMPPGFGSDGLPLDGPFDSNGLPKVFTPKGSESPGIIFELPTMGPGGVWHSTQISPQTYESWYWVNMYNPLVFAGGRQVLEVNDYGYPVRIPGTTTDIPTPDQYRMLYWYWEYNSTMDYRWTHPPVSYDTY